MENEPPPSYEDVIKSDKIVKKDNYWLYLTITLIFIMVLVVLPIILALTVDKN